MSPRAGDGADEGFKISRALRLAEACALAKEDSDRIVSTLESSGSIVARFFDSGEGPEAFVSVEESEIVLCFRGTDRMHGRLDRKLPGILKDWTKNLDYHPAPGPFGGQVHRGLYRVLVAADGMKRPFYRGLLEAVCGNLGEGRSLWVTGVSQGAITATLVSALFLLEGIEITGLYAFGSPCPGDRRFAVELESRLPGFYRVVHENDLLARLPPPFLRFESVAFVPAGRLHHLVNTEVDTRTDPWEQLGEQGRRFVEHLWSRLKGASEGDLQAELSETFSRGIKDHLIESYVSALERLVGRSA